ncbi:alpha/beta fold hydrolase [Ornithinimicrobium avium]|uniref:alpha/beta fold hydrolase n=1 Tax=Ornithinimicrobium avium TaxID=2283195 RepID=UPI001D19851D|nr:alpha/beta hydrolase [Ornithinimicrobium avium]
MRPGVPRTELVPGPDGDLEVLTTGRGEPRSLFVHGLAGSIATTRPYASKVPGTRTFVHLRGHGASFAPTDDDWGYAELAAEVWSVADRLGADRALGISMGAGALLAGLVQHPDRFSRIVLVLPAAIDRPREDDAMRRLERLAVRVEAGDVRPVAAHLLAEQPAAVRDDPGVVRWCREQAEALVTTGVAAALRVLPHRVPVLDRAELARVRCPVLVLGQEGDATHPADVARELAGLFPRGTVHVSGPDGIMWGHRAQTRDRVGAFLAGS